jgi:hypothetical protein
MARMRNPTLLVASVISGISVVVVAAAILPQIRRTDFHSHLRQDVAATNGSDVTKKNRGPWGRGGGSEG